MFKASDYRISPFELESVLIEHPAVAEAAVVPSPDPLRLAVPKAFVVLADGYEPSAETARSILEFARDNLAPYQRIRRLEFAELPKTISGKIRRVELRGREKARSDRSGALGGVHTRRCASSSRAGIEPGSPGVDSGRRGAPGRCAAKVRYEGDDVGDQDGDGPTARPDGRGDGRDAGGLAAAARRARPGPVRPVQRAAAAPTGSGEKWPCSLHRIATQARRLHEQNLARAIDTDLDA